MSEEPERGREAATPGGEEAAVRASYERLNAGDVAGALEALAPEAVWRESAELPGGGELRGRERVREFLTDFLESWERFEQRVEEVVARGPRLAVLIHMRGVGRESGLEIDTRYGHVWTMSAGKGIRVDAYRDPAAARAAIGAQPEPGAGERERPATEP